MRQQLELGMVVEYHLPFHLNMKFNNIPFQNSQTPKKNFQNMTKIATEGRFSAAAVRGQLELGMVVDGESPALDQ